MAQDTQNDEDKGAGPPSEHLRPYIVYRNPEEDPIRCALQEGARQLQAEGKPLVLVTKKDLK